MTPCVFAASFHCDQKEIPCDQKVRYFLRYGVSFESYTLETLLVLNRRNVFGSKSQDCTERQRTKQITALLPSDALRGSDRGDSQAR